MGAGLSGRSLSAGDCIPSLASSADHADPANSSSLASSLFSLNPSEHDPKLALLQSALISSPSSSPPSTSSRRAVPRLSLLGPVPIVRGRSYRIIASCRSTGALDHGRKIGATRARSGLRVGRQAQAIEAQISIMDQLAMLVDVKVKSAASPLRFELMKRTILRTEMAQTLGAG